MLDRNSASSQPAGQADLVRPASPVVPKPLAGLGSLRQRARLVSTIGGLFGILALAYVACVPATYTASALLLAYNRQISNTQDAVVLPGAADIPLVQNQIEMLRSRNVLLRVIDVLALDDDNAHDTLLGRLLSGGLFGRQGSEDKAERRALLLDSLRRKLTARRVGTSHLIAVNFTSSDPERAARVLNTVARVYLQELARAWDAGSSRAPAIRELFKTLGPTASVVSEAEPPSRPDGLAPSLLVVGATLIGLGMGAALAIFLDLLDNTLRSPEQVEHVLGLRCLGVLPRIRDGGARDRKRDPANAAAGFKPLDVGDSQSPQSRALRDVAAAVQGSLQPGVQSIGVTSAVPGEGATTVAIGLAQATAARGRRVLLVDAVPERPSVSGWAAAQLRRASAKPQKHSGTERARGILEVQRGLDVLPVGALSRADAYSVSAVALDQALRTASEAYDVVIVDLPSLASGPDIRAVTEIVDGFLLVVKWRATDSELVRQAVRSSGAGERKFIGAVLNMADAAALRQYGTARSGVTMLFGRLARSP